MRILPVNNITFLNSTKLQPQTKTVDIKEQPKKDVFIKEEKTDAQKAYEQEKKEKELAFKKKIQEPGKFTKKEQ